MHYLGRYTQDRDQQQPYPQDRWIDEDTVTIRMKDYQCGGVWKEITLDGVEFVRRFLMHVPPKRFVRIRHNSLLSNHNKGSLIPSAGT